ncbi:hypothetical protein U9M48_006539 [Paspalum notatum var. saurae]|uniref:Uncharacterized protein n=1 Tax=Paspalum notatum var. saurae TaxID=547442 RepID=A0AAQ3PYX8_PASNO
MAVLYEAGVHGHPMLYMAVSVYTVEELPQAAEDKLPLVPVPPLALVLLELLQIQYLSRVCWRISTICSCLRSRLRQLMAIVISSICRIRRLQCRTKLPIVALMLQMSQAKQEDWEHLDQFPLTRLINTIRMCLAIKRLITGFRRDTIHGSFLCSNPSIEV